jgi:hypothetical protein
MATALIEILSSIAPESAELIERLQKAKLNEKQIMISLLALNLEQTKKTDCMIQQLRDLRGDMARKGTI